MGAQPGVCTEHLELNLSDQECADEIAAHFSSISQEFAPLSQGKSQIEFPVKSTSY